MDTNPASTAEPVAFNRPPAYRLDGWSLEIQEAFIIALIEHGSVQAAANIVDRHITSAYRLRARDTGFATAWDAARRMAYARLRDEAMDRALNGTLQEIWHDGVWMGMKRVRSDRLLIALLGHLKYEAPPHEVEAIEDRRGNTTGRILETLAPQPPKPVRLRPARGRSVPCGGEPRMTGGAFNPQGANPQGANP